jgi:hypothetical protein
MGKKRSRAKQVSKGITHQNRNSISKAVRRDYMKSPERLQNQLEAHLKGKRVVLTIENPNKNETNKRFIKVVSTDHWKSGFRTK